MIVRFSAIPHSGLSRSPTRTFRRSREAIVSIRSSSSGPSAWICPTPARIIASRSASLFTGPVARRRSGVHPAFRTAASSPLDATSAQAPVRARTVRTPSDGFAFTA